VTVWIVTRAWIPRKRHLADDVSQRQFDIDGAPCERPFVPTVERLRARLRTICRHRAA
jgi:hypothetical protein